VTTSAQETEDIRTWLSTSQAANALGMSGMTIGNWIREGRLRAIRTTLGFLIDPSSVREMKEKRDCAKRNSA
jgi:excisionase family DNA binding protein